MIFGKHINRYYLRFAGLLILGLISLVAVDYLQLEIPKLYRMVINGINQGYVNLDGVQITFDKKADNSADGWVAFEITESGLELRSVGIRYTFAEHPLKDYLGMIE